MSDKRLQIYLDDHLALIVGEIELAARCHRSNPEAPLGEFLKRLEAELVDQQAVVKDVIHRVGGKDGIESLVKQGAAWFAEKLGRFKLNDSLLTYSSLSRVVELETLAAAAQERVALWDSLAAIAESDRRLAKFDFMALRNQSKKHLTALNSRRRRAAVEAFVGEAKT
jgi:hypothetical protein